MADGFHGYGTLLKVGSGTSPETFATVAAVKRIKPPAERTADIDVSHLESPNARRQNIPGMRSGDKLQVGGLYLPQNATQGNTGRGLIKLQRDRTIANFQIVFSDDDQSVWAITGYVSLFDPGEAGLDAAVEFSAEITLTEDSTPPVIS
jgi:hypothetical protein